LHVQSNEIRRECDIFFFLLFSCVFISLLEDNIIELCVLLFLSVILLIFSIPLEFGLERWVDKVGNTSGYLGYPAWIDLGTVLIYCLCWLETKKHLKIIKMRIWSSIYYFCCSFFVIPDNLNEIPNKDGVVAQVLILTTQKVEIGKISV
jgi:hypothetical protein